MDGGMADEGGKRRLPLWMLGVAAADQVRKSEENENENSQNVTGGAISKADKSKHNLRAKRNGKDPPNSDEKSSKENTSLLLKCETKQRTSKVRHEDAGCDGGVSGIQSEVQNCKRVGKEVRVSALRKPSKAKRLTTSDIVDEIQSLSPTEDDAELTMEDMMSIAEEIYLFES